MENVVVFRGHERDCVADRDRRDAAAAVSGRELLCVATGSLVYGHERRYQGKDVRKGRDLFEHIGAVSLFRFRNTHEFVSAHAHGRAMQCAKNT